ncbi:uncharacterized protein CTRU02_207410 [Colletotrichum truncatum]|uniref:Uncharacterized protein n=1 Tax=Colletotrichum truncatum TaxID=5467 RepID=A0ACC3Z0T6_COLTU|nr:uncharacterized protein CTRU02_00958 [Colletotrichum truncatum]KAF6800553.1 hypothetical protein CTRU02_00958 [Colletotrichum truncatum]
MRCSTVAVFGLAAVAHATWDGKFSYPPGIEPLGISGGGGIDFNIKTFGPVEGPPSDCISVWHPPHPDVYIDDCDSDKEHGWHWVHPGKPKWNKPGKDKDHDKPGKDKDHDKDHDKPGKDKDHDKPGKDKDHDKPDKPKEPEQPDEPATTAPPKWKWTTSTITQTAVSTIFSCPPSVPDCPANGGGTKYKTVTVPAVVTICPVPVEPNPVPPTQPVAPPKTTAPVQQPVPSNPTPPETLSSVPIPPPVQSEPPAAPPATTTKPNIGTVTRPNPTATTGRVVVTAGAVPNVQRAGGIVVAAVAAAAAFI